MNDRLIDLLLRRSPRERVLLALLVGVAVPVALVMGVMQPLAAKRAAAETAFADIQAAQIWVGARVAEQAALGPVGDRGPRAPIGSSGLEQSLIAARLRARLSELSNRVDGEVELRFDAVAFTDLMGWITATDPIWGYDIARLDLVPGADPGRVDAALRLTPQR